MLVRQHEDETTIFGTVEVVESEESDSLVEGTTGSEKYQLFVAGNEGARAAWKDFGWNGCREVSEACR